MRRGWFVAATRAVAVLVLSIVACVEPLSVAIASPGDPVPFGSVSAVRGSLLNPANGDVLLLTATGLLEFAPDGSVTRQFALSGSTGMAVLDDRIYVAEPAADTIVVVDFVSFTLAGELTTGASTCPTSLTSDGTRLWVGYGCQTGDVAAFDPASPSALPPPSRYPSVANASSAPEVAATASRLLALAPSPSLPDGERQTIRALFDIDGADLTARANVLGRYVHAPQLTPDGSHALVAGFPSALMSMSDLSFGPTYPGDDANPEAQLSPDGRHVVVIDPVDGPRLVVYATATGVAVHGTDLPLVVTPGGRAGAVSVFLAAFLGDSTRLLALAYYSGAVTGNFAAPLPGWRFDPAELAVAVASTAAGVDISGKLSFSDGTLPLPQLVTVTRSGAAGTVVAGVAVTDLTGAFDVVDPTPPAGRYTYRATWLGDVGHALTLSLVSTNVGGAPPLPAPPPTDVVESDHDVDLGLTSLAGAVVDDLHRHVLVIGDELVQARDFEGNLVGVAPLTGRPVTIVLSPDETTAFITEAGLDGIVVLDTATMLTVGTLPLGPIIAPPQSVAQVGDDLVYSNRRIEGLGYLPLADPLMAVTFPVEGDPSNLVTSHDQPSSFVAYSADRSPASVGLFQLDSGTLAGLGGGWNPQVAATAGDTALPGVPAYSDDGKHVLTIDGTRLVDLNAPGLDTGTYYDTGPFPVGGAYSHDGEFLFATRGPYPDLIYYVSLDVRPVGASPSSVVRTFKVPYGDYSSLPYPTRDQSRLFWVTSTFSSPAYTMHVLHEPTWPAPCLSVQAAPDDTAADVVDVSGTVRGSDGRGVPNANVTVGATAPDGSTRTAAVTTNADGAFTFAESTAGPGNYRYDVTAAATPTLTCTAAADADVTATLSASTTPAPAPADQTALTLRAAAVSPIAGTTDQLVGSVVDATTSMAIPNVAVRLLGRPHGQQAWTVVTTLVSDSAGRLGFGAVAKYNYDYELTFDGDSSRAAATSNVTSLSVRTRIGRSASTSVAKRGQTITFVATVWPSGPYAPVLQRYYDGGWHRVVSGVSLGHGRYAARLTFRTAGHYTYRFVVHATTRNLAGASAPITVRIV